MQYRGLNELRELFLSFFEGKEHYRMDSAPLVPQGDASLLLINSGMAPLKKYFLGQADAPSKRVTTCQKCIRTPDIERVGKTSRHGTYFEMLGNFSFGDYFKNEAIAWAWEFFTETLEIPKDKLYCSVYLEDDEAYDIWTKKIGVPESHMTRLGKADNFWEHGSGPCGPCSEIYFDRGENKGCGSPDCKVGCDCDRFVEVWNLVFSQFNSDGNGTYTEMENKNIDTGMGLERLACVIQGADNLFEVDTVQNIMRHICTIAGVEYKKSEKRDVSLRVITDHIRSTVFMVGDGVIPANEGRGYVLRRLLRRAARHGKLIGIEKPFLFEVTETVIKENEKAYPELREKADYIKKIIGAEEEKFSETIERGLELLTQHLTNVKSKLSGDIAFKLSDTFGFPIDLTIEMALEKGLNVDIARFEELVKIQRETARADRAAKVGSSWENSDIKFDFPATEFVGYDTTYYPKAKILYISDEKDMIILDKSPFYAESGGQVGDKGLINNTAILFKVKNTKKDADGHILHFGYFAKDINATSGETVNAKVDRINRIAIKRNHTSAHILQAVLREILGEHVHQAGQLVNEKECRFDFNHFAALTAEELADIESSVNHIIDRAYLVETKVMAIEDAKKEGAMALFGEKYGDTVRVVSIGHNISKEFCGGTHVSDTSQIGAFKIVSENSVAAGVRRITAVTGSSVLEMLNKYKNIVDISAKVLKIPNPFELEVKVSELLNETKEVYKELEKLHAGQASALTSDLIKNAVEKDGLLYLTQNVGNLPPETLRVFGDNLKEKYPNIVAILATVLEGKGTFLCACGKDAVSAGQNAGKIIKEICSKAGGKGGGRADSAMGGAGDISLIDKALKEIFSK